MITLINGFPQGPNGLIVPLGSIKMQLNADATIIAGPGGFVAADIPVVFQFDKNGALIQPAKIWSNEELDPQNALGLGTYYLVTFYDQNGAILNNTPLWWIFPETIGATVDISQMVAISTVGGNVIYYPRSIGNAGTVTSVGFVGDGTVLSSTPSTPVTTSGNITATLLTQSANLVLAGPTTGSAANPTFRALVSADLPALSIVWSSLQPAAGNLTLANTTYNTTFNQTTAAAWSWANITAATNSTPQLSPTLNLNGTYWTGSASAADIWSIQNIPGAGTNPATVLTFSHSGTPGGATVSFLSQVAVSLGLTVSGTVNGQVGVFHFNQQSGDTFNISSAGNASGNLTIYQVNYGSNPQPSVGQNVTVAGFIAHTSNNGYFAVASSTSSTLTLYNSGGIAETQAATGTVDNPYTIQSGFDIVLGYTNTYGLQGHSYVPSGGGEALPFVPVWTISAKGDAQDSGYFRIINDGSTGNHGLEIGGIIDGTGAAPVTVQIGHFGGISAVAFNTPITQTQAHGETYVYGSSTELITLSTGGTTTDSVGNLLPAGAIIDAVVARVTTTISGGSTPTTWEMGDATTAARFSSTGTALTAGSTVVGLNQMQGVVSTTATGPTQAVAAKVRITLDQTPGQGAVRVTVFYRQFTAPTS